MTHCAGVVSQWQASVRASVTSLASKHVTTSSSSASGSRPLSAQNCAQIPKPSDPHVLANSLSVNQEHFPAITEHTAAGSDNAAAVPLQFDGTDLSPLDDALLQLVLQTLSESSLEQLQSHQQRQQQQQQQLQQEAIERQLTLQLLAQSSLHQMQSHAMQTRLQEEPGLNTAGVPEAMPADLGQTHLNGLSQEQSQQQIDTSAYEAHEALLASLAQTALAELSQEKQQEQEQQTPLQQQQEVFEQQQRLLQQQSTVHDALLQQRQWEQAQQQRQVYAEQQKLIQQQQAMLDALQQQQQATAAQLTEQAISSQLGVDSISTGNKASAQPLPLSTAEMQLQGSHAPHPAQVIADDPPSPAAIRPPPSHVPGPVPAALAVPTSAADPEANSQHDTQAIVPASDISSAAATNAAAMSLQIPAAQTQLTSQHEDIKPAHQQGVAPTTKLPSQQLEAQLRPLPQAYYLVPAAACNRDGTLMLPPSLFQPAPVQPLPAQASAEAVQQQAHVQHLPMPSSVAPSASLAEVSTAPLPGHAASAGARMQMPAEQETEGANELDPLPSTDSVTSAKFDQSGLRSQLDKPQKRKGELKLYKFMIVFMFLAGIFSRLS